MKIQLPFDKTQKFPLTQKFGEKFMYGGKIVSHKGIDFAMPKYTKIIAPFSGFISRITPERETGLGHAVYIESYDTKDGVFTAVMAHLETIDVPHRLDIKIGERIGQSGRTGFWRGVNGYHLHFELRLNGRPIDPLQVLKVHDEQAENLFNQNDDTIKTFLGNYTVKKGDTLWAIAEKYYGNGGHYVEIFRVNEDVITNPHLITPGMILRIPGLKNKGI